MLFELQITMSSKSIKINCISPFCLDFLVSACYSIGDPALFRLLGRLLQLFDISPRFPRDGKCFSSFSACSLLANRFTVSGSSQRLFQQLKVVGLLNDFLTFTVATTTASIVDLWSRGPVVPSWCPIPRGDYSEVAGRTVIILLRLLHVTHSTLVS